MFAHRMAPAYRPAYQYMFNMISMVPAQRCACTTCRHTCTLCCTFTKTIVHIESGFSGIIQKIVFGAWHTMPCSCQLLRISILQLVVGLNCIWQVHAHQASYDHTQNTNQSTHSQYQHIIVPNSQCPVLVLVPAMSSHRCPCLRPALLFLLRSSTLVLKFADDCQTNNAYVPSPCLRLSCPRLRPVPVSVPVRPGFPLTSFAMIV